MNTENKNYILACLRDIKGSLDALEAHSLAGNHEAVKVFYDRITSSINNLQGEMK
tara:strand:+ start:272 stop:436 length:165 start_codon:yes stop_codon:yes gene_type:complete